MLHVYSILLHTLVWTVVIGNV